MPKILTRQLKVTNSDILNDYLLAPNIQKYKSCFYAKWHRKIKFRQLGKWEQSNNKQKITFYSNLFNNMSEKEKYNCDLCDASCRTKFLHDYIKGYNNNVNMATQNRGPITAKSVQTGAVCFKALDFSQRIKEYENNHSAGENSYNNNNILSIIYGSKLKSITLDQQNDDDFIMAHVVSLARENIERAALIMSSFTFCCPICRETNTSTQNALLYKCGHMICYSCVLAKIHIYPHTPQRQIFHSCDICRSLN